MDDFSNLAVEECFIKPLSTIFTPRTVGMLEDYVIEDIAAEDESSRHERQRLGQKINVLQTSLHRLHSLDRHHLARKTFQPLLTIVLLIVRLVVTKSKDTSNVESKYPDADAELSDKDGAEIDEAMPEVVEEPYSAEEPSRAAYSGEVVEEAEANGIALEPSDDWNSFGISSSKKKSKKKRHPSADIFE